MDPPPLLVFSINSSFFLCYALGRYRRNHGRSPRGHRHDKGDFFLARVPSSLFSGACRRWTFPLFLPLACTLEYNKVSSSKFSSEVPGIEDFLCIPRFHKMSPSYAEVVELVLCALGKGAPYDVAVPFFFPRLSSTTPTRSSPAIRGPLPLDWGGTSPPGTRKVLPTPPSRPPPLIVEVVFLSFSCCARGPHTELQS